MSKTQNEVEALADEIRASENLFVDTAVAAFRERVKMEYYRLRGYAVEAGKDTIGLQLNVTFGFATDNRFVLVQSIPQFIPEPGETRQPVGQPKKR